MFKHLMNGSSLLALALRAPDDETGADAKAKLREQLSKGNTPEGQQQQQEQKIPDPENENDEEDSEDEEDEESEDEEVDENKDPEKKEETEAEKVEREKQEKIAAKAQRKQDRQQRRIDEAIAAKKNAEAEVARLRAQLEANPDQKFTAEEIEARAKALAAEQKKADDLAKLQKDFEDDCEALQKEAKKIDKDFDEKVNDMAEQFGPIPSFMIGVLTDLDNGAEVLAKVAADDDLAEEIYELAKKPTKLTKKLVELSQELIKAKLPPKKKISKVPDPVDRVTGSRNQTITLTEADTKNMDEYVRKRRAQMEESRKQGRLN